MFCKNDGLKNFSKFTWKHMRLSLCLNKVGQQLNWKKILWHMIFLWILWNFIRTPFYRTSLVATSRIGLSPTLSLPSSESSCPWKKPDQTKKEAWKTLRLFRRTSNFSWKWLNCVNSFLVRSWTKTVYNFVFFFVGSHILRYGWLLRLFKFYIIFFNFFNYFQINFIKTIRSDGRIKWIKSCVLYHPKVKIRNFF